MYSVNQHWDPLRSCVVGQSYPPEFYAWITVPHVRALFERIAIETEEDYQGIIKKLRQFDVEVFRPKIPTSTLVKGRHFAPPMTPRDYMIMIGQRFYQHWSFELVKSYNKVKDPTWPSIISENDYDNLPLRIRDECENLHNFSTYKAVYGCYDHIFDHVKAQGNEIIDHYYDANLINGAMVTQIGRDLYFGTNSYHQDVVRHKAMLDLEFVSTRNHVVNTGGHTDATFCPVAPGLIISLEDSPTYAQTFPGWEVIYLRHQGWEQVEPFQKLKQKNRGKWWIPGFEHDQDVIELVETWLSHWTGFVEETVFDINMLILDPQNVMVFNHNDLVFDALDRYNITAHIVPFRHRFFWDGGIHCVTACLDRPGAVKDYFPWRH